MKERNRILVADDTRNIRILLTKCLEMEGYDVETALDGQQALDMLCKYSYDLVFLDIKMPYFSGTEVLRNIRDKGIDTPVIIITAYATVKNAVECTKMGAIGYLQKPFTPEKIRSILNDAKASGRFVSSGEKRQKSIEQAILLIDDGRYADALTRLKDLLPEYPLDADIFGLLGKVCENLDNKSDASKFYSISNALRK